MLSFFSWLGILLFSIFVTLFLKFAYDDWKASRELRWEERTSGRIKTDRDEYLEFVDQVTVTQFMDYAKQRNIS